MLHSSTSHRYAFATQNSNQETLELQVDEEESPKQIENTTGCFTKGQNQ